MLSSYRGGSFQSQCVQYTFQCVCRLVCSGLYVSSQLYFNESWSIHLNLSHSPFVSMGSSTKNNHIIVKFVLGILLTQSVSGFWSRLARWLLSVFFFFKTTGTTSNGFINFFLNLFIFVSWNTKPPKKEMKKFWEHVRHFTITNTKIEVFQIEFPESKNNSPTILTLS